MTLAIAAIVAILGTALPADAEGTVEPTYGRIDGDVCIVVGVGAAFSSRAPRAAGELRLRYLESAGVFATYEDGSFVDSGSDPRRVLAAGLELRPVFLFRWLQGLEMRRARLDLALDSVGVELGTTFSQPAVGFLDSFPGLQAGVGFELPANATARGVWLGVHAGLRWGAHALALENAQNEDDRAFYLALTIAWHELASAHLVDWGDAAPR